MVPMVAVLSSSCRGGSNVAPVAMTSSAAPPMKVGPTPPGIPVLRVVYDDPRLARVRELERAKDWVQAATAFREARPADLPASDRCAWDYVEGRLLTGAGASLEAAAVFGRIDTAGCPLAGYARLRAAQAFARAGHGDEAIAMAKRVPPEPSLTDEVNLVVAESLAAKGDRAGALPLWRAWLASNPHGSRWVDTSLRIANAFLDGVDGPPDPHADEAFDLATKIVVEAPKLADASGATATRARAVALLKLRRPQATDILSETDRAKQAQAWLDNGEATKAFEGASALLKAAPSIACRAALTRANAAAKLKDIKVDVWSEAVTTCDKDEQLVTALYSGAKARAGKDPKLAIDWFGRLEKLFPTHRLADDARYRSALLIKQSADEGHEGRAEEMLRTLPDAYPAGDMRTEALFQLALGKMEKRDWSGAKVVLDRIIELTPDNHHWATAGRAEYFRARAAQSTGDEAQASALYAAILEKHPLSYYMLLAHARLAERDASRAARLLKDFASRDATGAFPSHPHPLFDTPGAVRAARLLEVGEVEAARRELSLAGVVADGVEPETLWIVGALYNQAGVPELGHAVSRGRLTDFLSHYPEGKWRSVWQIAYPRAFEPLVASACKDNALPSALAWAIMREESSFVADAKSRSNAIGLMQLMGPTARWVATGTPFGSDEASLKRPEVSIGLGVRLLSKLRVTHRHPALAIGAYNGGSGAVDRWVTARSNEDLDLFVELVPFEETRNYIKRVLSSQAAYAYLYDPSSLAEPLGLSFRVGR